MSEIPLITTDERARFVPFEGDDGVEPQTMPSILARTVAAHADRPALVSETRTLTYGDVDAESNRLARLLIAAGAGPETIVAVAMPRSDHHWISVWAVFKTGAAVVPVDPKYPVERINHVLTDSRAVIGVTVASHREALPDTVDWIVLDQPLTGSEAPIAPHELRGPIRPANPVWLIYTSGSTGLPKGVTVSHAGVTNFIASVADIVDITPQDRMLQVASPSFDGSMSEFLYATSPTGQPSPSPRPTFTAARISRSSSPSTGYRS